MSTDSRFVSVRRNQRPSRAQIAVLAGCAFVLGLALSAAAFVGVWQTTARQSDRSSAQRALADSRLRDALARSATLSLQLQHTKASLLSARGDRRQLKLELGTATRQAAVSRQDAAVDRTRLATLRQRAAAVTSDVAALEGYVATTPSQALDSGFLRSQLEYVAAAARRLQQP